MKVSDLKFNVELKSKHSLHTRFPRENCAGIALLRPDMNKQRYKLKITLQESTCQQAKISPAGFAMAKLSDCSNGLQILWQATQGEKFKGYRLRPSGAYRNDALIEKELKSRNTRYLPLFTEISIDFDKLDTKKTNRFDLKYCDVLHAASGVIVIDITDLRLYVAPPVNV